MALTAFNPFACIVAHLTTVRIGLDALAIENAVTFRVIDGGLFQIVDGEMAKFSCVPWIGWGWLRVRV